MSQCVVIGRGYNYATANEWALKLKELTYVVAESYSSADFQHGPIAIVSHGFPDPGRGPDGCGFQGCLRFALQPGEGARRRTRGRVERRRPLSTWQRPRSHCPKDMPEWLSPLVGIVPAQLFCYHLTRARGYDTETPRGLLKVTRTW